MTVIGNTETSDCTLLFRVVEGNLYHLCYLITGDAGGSVTVNTALATVLAHAVGVKDAAAGYNPAITWSGGVGTYAVAPLDDVSHYLHVWGW